MYDASPSAIRKLLNYYFWNIELDEMIDELGEENNTVAGAGASN